MSQGCRCLCALALVLSSSAAFRADGQAPVGSEFAVAFDLLYHADSPAAAMSTNGSFVVVWESYSYSSPSGRDIAAQRYSSAGTPLAGFMVAGGNGTDSQPAVTSDAAGNFVVAWRGPYPGGYKVFAQRYSSAGDALGGRIQVTFVASLSHDPDLAATAAGDFVVVWRADATYSVPAGIVATRFSSSGTPLTGEFAVSTSTSGSQGHPAVAVGPNGDFVVVWEGFSGPTQNIFGRRFSSAGAPLGGELRVNSLTAAASYDPHVVLDSAGNFIVVWRSFGGDGAGNAISARRFSSSGAAIGNEFVLNAYTTGDQSRPSLAADPSGDFVAVWESVGQDAGGVGVFGRRFSSSGTPQGGEFRVNTYTSQNQFIPAVG
ncbi:MAG TPA: hypothetical protein VGR00_12940, partial [Thermoanaerobaculia bacterium]|nr:hypothetical protein [Thermoanaerobaculia bacterium]